MKLDSYESNEMPGCLGSPCQVLSAQIEPGYLQHGDTLLEIGEMSVVFFFRLDCGADDVEESLMRGVHQWALQRAVDQVLMLLQLNVKRA